MSSSLARQPGRVRRHLSPFVILFDTSRTIVAARVYQHHQARNGEKPHHRHAKQLFSGAIGVYIDRIVETKGLDALDKKKAKREAQSRVEAQAQSNYS
ncbi:hypothetical protein FRB93_005531 [Tulasnella sp. JGI-2019a]|nr:hypothetical protein FRB93_005531 [Tulasnella sp. JGI-2019a]